MALKIVDHGSPEYQEMVRLREDILRRPLGLTLEEIVYPPDEDLPAQAERTRRRRA